MASAGKKDVFRKNNSRMKSAPNDHTGKLRHRSRLPRLTIDLANPRHLRNGFIGLIFLLCLTTGLLIGGYKTYEYTESAQFCGTVCHPMFSQFARYQASNHANVACADCHIGPGATFFVKSKLDGIRQVYAVLAHSYQRPIKSPVKDLRPARETCETCHTPNSYRDNIVKSIIHYENDEANSSVISTLILKMGGWKNTIGVSQGIHWHITNPVYYIAADEKRQVMVWIGVEQPDGSFKEYYSRDSLNMARTSFVEEARTQGKVRLLDCIDCHNRAAHLIPPPEQMIDEAISDGLISRQLPYIRVRALEILKTPYVNKSEAQAAIDQLADFYVANFPQVYATKHKDLSAAISELKQIYSSTNFPEMNLNWETNPNNETHTPSLGCFRCHDDNHVSVNIQGDEVGVISVECNLCHTVPIIGRESDLVVEAPVIVGKVPAGHEDFRWTIEHRNVTDAEKQDCFVCHGQGFCNNGACHNLSHPEDMLYKHAEIFRSLGNEQVCYACHQDITCVKCHAGGVITNP